MVYYVAYDLRLPETNYPDLIKLLQGMRGIRLVRSDWLVESDQGAGELRTAIRTRGKMDDNDRIVVAEVRNHAGWHKLLSDDTTVKAMFAKART